MTRLLLTSDWQIGMKAAHVGARATAVQEARFETVRRIISLAGEHSVDAIVVAGDMFEDNAVDQVLVQRIADILATSPVPVLILPGNHDPLVPGSVYDREIWVTLPHVHVWRDCEPYSLSGIIFYPCPVTTKFSREDPTRLIPSRSPGSAALRVGVAHGSHMSHGAVSNDTEFPIAADAAENLGLDALLLGHWHSTYIAGPVGGYLRTFYAGSPEPTRFGELNSGNILVIDLEPHEEPKFTQHHTATLEWSRLSRTIQTEADVSTLRTELQRFTPEQAGRMLLELTLDGVVPLSVISMVDRQIRPLVEARFLYSRLVLDRLCLEPTEEEINQLVTFGPLHAVYQHLLTAAHGNVPQVNPDVARQAIHELYKLHKEVIE